MQHETTNQPFASTENLTARQNAEGALVVVDQRSGQTTTYGDFGELADGVELTPLDDELKRLVVELAQVLSQA